MGYLQRMVNTYSQKTKTNITHSKSFGIIDESECFIILLFPVKSKLSSPYNRVLRVKGIKTLKLNLDNDILLLCLYVSHPLCMFLWALMSRGCIIIYAPSMCIHIGIYVFD